MKIVKYGPGMKAEKNYKIECSHCHSVFKASPFEVDFLTEDGEVSTHATSIYKATCPVCEGTDKYQTPQKKKHRKPKLSILALFVILIITDVFVMLTLPFAFGDDHITVSRVIVISIIALHIIMHTFMGGHSI